MCHRRLPGARRPSRRRRGPRPVQGGHRPRRTRAVLRTRTGRAWSAMASTAGRLTASVSLREALADADVALICVGTPSEKNGNLGLDQLRRVSQEIAESLPGRNKPLVVAVRSTVYPGTCEEVVLPQMGGSPLVSVVSNPGVPARRRGRSRLHGALAAGDRRIVPRGRAAGGVDLQPACRWSPPSWRCAPRR